MVQERAITHAAHVIRGLGVKDHQIKAGGSPTGLSQSLIESNIAQVNRGLLAHRDMDLLNADLLDEALHLRCALIKRFDMIRHGRRERPNRHMLKAVTCHSISLPNICRPIKISYRFMQDLAAATPTTMRYVFSA